MSEDNESESEVIRIEPGAKPKLLQLAKYHRRPSMCNMASVLIYQEWDRVFGKQDPLVSVSEALERERVA